MLVNSRKIVKEVNNTTQLDEALSLVVQRVKSSMDANACSIYLNDMQSDQYFLMAASGLVPDAVGRARVNLQFTRPPDSRTRRISHHIIHRPSSF